LIKVTTHSQLVFKNMLLFYPAKNHAKYKNLFVSFVPIAADLRIEK
jgi:GTP-sensing pleiotropic transcriptional regulator CodY